MYVYSPENWQQKPRVKMMGLEDDPLLSFLKWSLLRGKHVDFLGYIWYQTFPLWFFVPWGENRNGSHRVSSWQNPKRMDRRVKRWHSKLWHYIHIFYEYKYNMNIMCIYIHIFYTYIICISPTIFSPQHCVLRIFPALDGCDPVRGSHDLPSESLASLKQGGLVNRWFSGFQLGDF